MAGLKANLRYWGHVCGQMLLQIFVVYAIYATFIGQAGSVQELPRTFCVNSLRYYPMLSMFLLCVMGFSVVSLYIPFTLSMGSTRKDSFWGMEIMMFGMELIMYVFAMGVGAFGRSYFENVAFGDTLREYGLVFFSLIILAMCFFHIVGICNIKFNRTVGFIVYFGIAMVCIGCGTFIMMQEIKNTFLYVPFINPAVIAGIAVLCAVTGYLFYRQIKKLEVRV